MGLKENKYWLETILTEGEEKLNDWERSFLASIEMKIDKGYELTPNQADKLEQIYERITE